MTVTASITRNKWSVEQRRCIAESRGFERLRDDDLLGLEWFRRLTSQRDVLALLEFFG